MGQICAPFTPEQVEALNEFQTAGQMHPFTCANRGDEGHIRREGSDLGQLIATPNGWTCPDCDYTQDWAHDFMADGRADGRGRGWLSG
jgi:hypothetical protein